MGIQLGTMDLGVAFVGDTGNLERALDSADNAVGRFGRQAAQDFNRTGLSARSMSAALRGVPAQFTDIFTSLQAGQAPLTVFLQQGGQLKDMFGGIGPAARALGGYVAGLVNPFTVVAAAVGTLAVAAHQGDAELRQLRRTLILIGDVAGVTADGAADIARQIDALSVRVTQGYAAEVVGAMLRAGVRGEAQLRRFTMAATEFERAGGGAVAEVAKNFEALGREPVAASGRLNEAMGYLTESTIKQIKALEDQGSLTAAARLAQDAYAGALEARTPALVKNLGLIELGWEGVKNGAREAWDAMLGIGRPDTLAQQVEAVEKRLADLRGHHTLGKGQGFDLVDPRLAADSDVLASLQEQQRISRIATDLAADRAQRERSLVAQVVGGSRKPVRSDAGGRGGTAKDPYADANRYLEILQKQLQAAQGLTAYENLLEDIRSGSVGKLSPDLRMRLESTAKQIDADKELLAITKEFSNLNEKAARKQAELAADGRRFFEATRTPIERLNIELARQDELLRKLGPAYKDTYMRANEAAQDRYDTETKLTEKISEVDQFTQRAAQNIQDYLGSSFQQIMTGTFDDIGESFSSMLNNMVAQAAAAQLSKYLFGDLLTGGAGSKGAIGDFIGSAASSLFSFDGGGYTGSGARSGGLDGRGGFLAMLHPDETVIDHTRGQGGGTTTHNYNITVAMPQGATRETALQFGSQVARRLSMAQARNG